MEKSEIKYSLKNIPILSKEFCPSPCSDFIPFEKGFSDMVTSLKFGHVQGSFQHELNEGICNLKSSQNVFVFVDKNNIYEISKEHDQKLLHDNVTKTYQKTPPKLEGSINLEAKIISTKLKINNRIERIARAHAFVTLKDHKDNFAPIQRVV